MRLTGAGRTTITFVGLAAIVLLVWWIIVERPREAERNQIRRFLASSRVLTLCVPVRPEETTVSITDPEQLAQIRLVIQFRSGGVQSHGVPANGANSIEIHGDGQPAVRLRVMRSRVFSFRNEGTAEESSWLWNCDDTAFHKLTEIGRIDWERLFSTDVE